MADAITIKALQDASLDAKTLEEVVNGNDTKQVTTRLGENYPSVKKAIKTLFENGGLPATPFATKALMTASALANDKYAMVTDDTVNNGLYVKTAGAWVKSNYSILSASQTYNLVTTMDASAISGSINLSLLDAANIVPVPARKNGFKLTFNGTESYTFIGDDPSTQWGRNRFWLRVLFGENKDLANKYTTDMIYTGFSLDNNIYTNAEIVDERSALVIIPLPTDSTGEVISTLTLKLGDIHSANFNLTFLDKNGKYIGRAYGSPLVNAVAIPSGARYVSIPLDTYTAAGVGTYVGSLTKLKEHGIAFYTDSVNAHTTSINADKNTTINYLRNNSITQSYRYGESGLVTPYFNATSATNSDLNGNYTNIHIAQIIKKITIVQGHYPLKNPDTGEYYKFWVHSATKTATGAIGFWIYREFGTGVETAYYNVSLSNILENLTHGVAEYTIANGFSDNTKIIIEYDPSSMPNIGNIAFGKEKGLISEYVVRNASSVENRNRGVEVVNLIEGGVSRVSSNMAIAAANPITIERSLTNGMPAFTVRGDNTKDHQQNTLRGSALARFDGKAEVHAFATATYPNNPKISVLREKSSVDYTAGNTVNQGLEGLNADSQWVHPDMTYSETAIGGYKYWMINSCFPNGNDRKEDAEMFVSNTGTSWKRVKGYEEEDTENIGFKNPQVFWNTNYPNTFLPVPISGTFEFAKEGDKIESSAITNYLNHDPAITTHNGYVIAYILMNFAFSGLAQTHKYIICLRTNDGTNWEIVREDGSTMPYNEDNAKLLFTKTGGVRNHHAFFHSASNITGSELSPQVVKVSDNEWYMYTRNSDARTNVASGSKLFLLRYSGTSPYTFDYSSGQAVSKTTAEGGNLWHFGLRYYDGLYYILFNGYMMTSTDGISFTATPYPFFWRGMCSDIYKPTFIRGHDGKIKIAYGITQFSGTPHPYMAQFVPPPVRVTNSGYIYSSIMATLLCEYNSFADIMQRSTVATKDAYIDVVVTVISQRTKSTRITLLPCLRSGDKVEGVDVSFDDEVYVVAYLNTRNGGVAEFGGVSVVLPNSLSY